MKLKLFDNKKGESVFDSARKSIFWGIILVVITIIIIVFTVLIASYQNKLTIIPEELQAELLSLRFTKNADCFAYEDQATQRVYPEMIDLSKFTKEQLFNCYSTPNEKGYLDYNFRLKLENHRLEIKTNEYYFIGNEGNYYDDFIFIKKVLVRENEQDKLVEDNLFVYMQKI